MERWEIDYFFWKEVIRILALRKVHIMRSGLST